jgi:glycosyltransferase involved in cell wall biosynthesis
MGMSFEKRLQGYPRQNPLVSAVIPAYNAELTIADAVKSVLAQTSEVAEIIVVDDGSSDRTAEVAASFPRTRVIRQPNGGVGAARNAGIHAASGEWIAFLDSDDAWLPTKTEIQLAYITPEAGVIHCNRFDPIQFGNLWHRQAHVTPSGAFVRKQALLDVGGFEESRSFMGVEDLNLWLKIALTDWRFVPSQTALYKRSEREQSLSADDSRMARAELANIDMMGKQVSCQPAEIERVRQASRIEYAMGLVACHRWDQAAQLLRECTPDFASRYLSLAGFLMVNRMARTNLVRWLQTVDGKYELTVCSGECGLPEVHRRQCMESCHKPYFRPAKASWAWAWVGAWAWALAKLRTSSARYPILARFLRKGGIPRMPSTQISKANS